MTIQKIADLSQVVKIDTKNHPSQAKTAKPSTIQLTFSNFSVSQSRKKA
jgi:hypothetical protein